MWSKEQTEGPSCSTTLRGILIFPVQFCERDSLSSICCTAPAGREIKGRR